VLRRVFGVDSEHVEVWIKEGNDADEARRIVENPATSDLPELATLALEVFLGAESEENSGNTSVI
jgi:hypothetical protein